MNGEKVREVFETILPDDALLELAREFGLQQRERRMNAALLIRSLVIAASSAYGGRQADAARLYFDGGGAEVARGGFYNWFGEPLERCMERCRDKAFAYARSQPVDLPGMLGRHVRDWHIVDSATVKLDQSLVEEYPGTGDYAALKVHKRFSVGVGTAVDYHLSPAREHDGLHLKVDESWSGLGLLADLGYASHQLLRDCEAQDVRYVIRLKENWKPRVERVVRGTTIMNFVKGTDLDVLLDFGTIQLCGKPLDLDVVVGEDIHCRLVAVDTPKGYCFYLTNLPRDVGPKQVADLYRVRWEIESDNKLDKSCHKLNEIGARKGPAVRALVHASMIASMIICLLAHHHRLAERPPPRRGADRTKPPIHPQMMARAAGHAALLIADAMTLTGREATAEWDRIARLLLHQGTDPNWRRRPSILDQHRGWKVKPGRSRRATAKRATG